MSRASRLSDVTTIASSKLIPSGLMRKPDSLSNIGDRKFSNVANKLSRRVLSHPWDQHLFSFFLPDLEKRVVKFINFLIIIIIIIIMRNKNVKRIKEFLRVVHVRKNVGIRSNAL